MSFSFSAFSQQDPFLSGDVFITPIWHNPASFGTWNKFSVNAVGRGVVPKPSWNPRFFLINTEFKFGYSKKNGLSYDLTKIQSGVGLNYYFDAVGFSQSQSYSVNYNIQLKLKKHSRLSFGISPGFQTISFIDPIWNPPTDSLDPNLPQDGSQTRFSMGVGIMYYSRTTYLGLASTHIVPTTYDSINFTLARHYYLNAGHKIPITRKSTIFPTINLAADGATFSYSTLVLFQYTLNYTAGLGYGRGGNIRGMLGYELKNFMLQYFVTYNPHKYFSNNFGYEIRFSYKLFHAPACSTCEMF